jgi:hypothetical protein
MSFVNLEASRDVAQETVETKTSFEITSLTAAQTRNINAFAALASDTGFLANAQGTATTIPLSSAFRHVSNYYFSSTGGTTVPVAHEPTSTTSLLRSIQIGRTTMDDAVMSGTVTAVFAFGTTANNTYIDVPETSITASIGRKGALVSQGNTSNVVGTVFYESGSLVFHGGTGWPHFLTDSSSGFTFGSASAGKVVCTQLSFKSVSILKRSIFFCRAFNQDFNYTNNPTSISNATLGTITGSLTAEPRSYITTVGLYDDEGNMLAVAKVSPPIKKTFSNEITLGVQLQY